MYKLFLAGLILAGLCYQGYRNYKSYPKTVTSIHHDVNKERGNPNIASKATWRAPSCSNSYELTIKTKKKDWKR